MKIKDSSYCSCNEKREKLLYKILSENHRGEDNLKIILCLLTNTVLYYITAKSLFYVYLGIYSIY